MGKFRPLIPAIHNPAAYIKVSFDDYSRVKDLLKNNNIINETHLDIVEEVSRVESDFLLRSVLGVNKNSYCAEGLVLKHRQRVALKIHDEIDYYICNGRLYTIVENYVTDNIIKPSIEKEMNNK